MEEAGKISNEKKQSDKNESTDRISLFLLVIHLRQLRVFGDMCAYSGREEDIFDILKNNALQNRVLAMLRMFV